MRIRGGDDEEAAVSAPPQHLVFAYYITGHGFGHATRALEVVRHLIAAGHDVHVVTGAPEFVFTTEIKSPNLHIRKVLLDCGAVQADALTVDRLASLEKYHQTAVVPRESILRTEVEWLNSIKADLVVSDVVPVACRAAADAGIRSVCVTNFSWDFIYAEYVVAAGHHHRSIVWQIAEDYSHCEFLLRLPGYCPMPAFRDVIDVPLVVRRLHKSRSEVRKELGIADDVKVVIFNFGGQPAGWKLKKECLPDGWLCLVCGASDTQALPPNFIKLAKDAYTPDFMAASDCMLGKIGYGTVSEALAYKLPFVFVRRDYFNEEPFLRNMLEHYQCGIEMIRRDLLTGHWKPYLLRAITLQACYDGPINGGEVSAHILQDTAVGKKYISGKLSGARRLRDAIVLGYQLQRAPGRDVGIPDWYSLSEKEIGVRPAPASHEINGSAESSLEDFEILHGDMQGLTDTMAFLTSLSGLVGNDPRSPEKQPRERAAASVLFDWEDEIYVARAPGRLDVMGGIADYSGSLVLQMPIREACHVAVQRSDPIKQKLWKHTQARQLANGGAVPVLQIVSFGSELSNRAPTFDMDLSDFMDGDKPISYDTAKEYFSQDPSQKWAAYVAGTILVLMTELGVRFADSMSILVSSSVPEGKGVSSSASVEVATMSAIAAVYGLNITPRDLAILCQKVENRVVGAPCGVMDQMTSACGEANKLLAMVCQPAEVKELVSIPTHIRFWGLDSGIRHSVGGTDYGSARVGTYMGREIIKCAASDLLSQSFPSVPMQSADTNSDDYEEHGVDLLRSEASLEYLCNLRPHRYEGVYAKDIPEIITGDAFLEKYGDHNDAVTVVDPKRSYSVKAPTRHPIYENFRVEAFKALLTATKTDEQLSALGELMYQCHYSYNACGLGSDGTDRLVNLVQEIHHRKTSQNGGPSLFGAKITGGGSGGSVCGTGESKDTFKASKKSINYMTISHDEKFMGVSSKTTRLFSVHDKKEILKIPSAGGPIQLMSVSDDARFLVSSIDNNKEVQICTCDHDSCSIVSTASLAMQTQPKSVECTRSTSYEGGGIVLAVSKKGVAYVWHLQTLSQGKVLPTKISVKNSLDRKGRIPIISAKLCDVKEDNTIKVHVVFGPPDCLQFKAVELGETCKDINLVAEYDALALNDMLTSQQRNLEQDAKVNSRESGEPDLQEITNPTHQGRAKKRTASVLDSTNDTTKGGNPEYNLDEPTMEEKLASLNLLSKSESTKEQSSSMAPPSADSVHILLKQALRADDHAELLKCVYNRDEKVIVKSISLLTPADVVKLLKFFVLQIQSRGATLVCLLPWLQTLLSRHMSSIVSQESSVVLLNSLYQLIDARTSTFKSALQLSTTLDYLFSEIVDDETDEEEAVPPIIYEDKDTDEEESEVDAMETDGESEKLGDVTDASEHSDRSEIMSD